VKTSGGDGDARWMGAAIACSERGRGRTWPNPNVGCVIVANGRVVGRGWTGAGGRPHAEAIALDQAGDAARGSTLFTTLEPCAHTSERGPTCSDLIAKAGVARVVIAVADPDPRTDGKGVTQLRAAEIDVVEGVETDAASRAMAGFLTRQRLGRPHVTLKLALSLDGCIARADGESQWITGPEARAHGHLERSRVEAILVGRRTVEVDSPRLDVRLLGLEGRSPKRYVLSTSKTVRPELVEGLPFSATEEAKEKTGLRQAKPERWATVISSPQDIANLPADHILVEGGAQTASAFLVADLVDRLLIYRAPILIGGGKPSLGDIGLTSLAGAHNRWRIVDSRMLGVDRLDIYQRVRD
jgi:diaminohydroxyphosphoribosylaminopyrimidine deaminase / 5-amino-6-(5-phosphoribosylamino)uracil reductase